MRAVLIDADNQVVREVETTGKLHDIYGVMKVSAIQSLPPYFTNQMGLTALEISCHSLFTDEEWRLNGTRRGFLLAKYPEPIMGNALIIGCSVDGDTCSATVDCASIKLRGWYDGPAPEPEITIVAFPGGRT